MSLKASGALIQVLAFFEERNSAEQGPALWAALHEVEQFYRRAGPDLQFKRFYISPVQPSTGALRSAWRSIENLLTKGPEYVPEPPRDGERVTARISAADVQGPSQRTYDQEKLCGEVRRILNLKRSDENLLIVTDRPITPPPDWRYIIWDLTSEGGVISTAPLDPMYWRDREPNRIAHIKHRTRCSALTITGSQLGLERCENFECFMFDDVDSVTALDVMTELGMEHGIKELSGSGFEAIATDPSVVQPLLPKGQARALGFRR